MKLKLMLSALFAVFFGANIFAGSIPYKGYIIPIPNEPEPQALACLAGKFEGNTGELKAIHIPIDYTGRIAVGDLDGDGTADFVVSRRFKLTAYNVCGEKLWSQTASTNWDIVPIGSGASESAHPYWNWSNYGYIADVDKDGVSEFLHIGADFRTLYIRNGHTGQIETVSDIGAGKWLYVAAGKAAGDSKGQSSNIFVAQEPGRLGVKSFYKSGSNVVPRWTVDRGFYQSRYLSPVVADINGDGVEDFAHSTMAITGGGTVLWAHNFTGNTPLGAHTLNIRDIDPDRPGLEASFSMYGPKKGKPSIVMSHSSGGLVNNDFGGVHPHQHTTGDFSPATRGLEVLARHNDGASHWMINRFGQTIKTNVRLNPRSLVSRWGLDWGTEGGEIVNGIEWDGVPGTEVLYTERHVSFRNVPLLVIHDLSQNRFVTRAFHGGVDVPRTDTTAALSYRSTSSWYGWIHRGDSVLDGPYEGGSHVMDIIGDGREEIIALSQNMISIYYNSGNAQVPRRWGDRAYESRKKLWTQVYNPR